MIPALLLLLTLTSVAKAGLAPPGSKDPNNMLNYLSKQSIEALESSTKISTDLSEVTFILWTPENGAENHWIFTSETDPQELLDHGFDPKRPTKFIAHGWNSNGIGFTKKFAAGYFSHPKLDYNVIAVDWQPLSTWDNYFVAAKNAVKVGQHSGEVIGVQKLIKALGQTQDQIHAIGHSLGGHLVGHFGRAIKTLTGKPITRVSALDPAKPWFDMSDESNKISKEDAILVDIIHTNSGSLLDGRLSLPEKLGHVDFYPNGGEHQPGCNDACIGVLCFEFNLWDLFSGSCSHGRAHEYYVESIYSAPVGERFISESCDSWDHYEAKNCHEHVHFLQMGENLSESYQSRLTDQSAFYLATNENAPFSANASIE